MRHLHYISKWARWQWQIPYFFDQMLRLLVFRCSWLLFKGDVYFHGKSADFNGGWIRPLWGSWLELAMFWHWTIIYTNCTSIQTVQVVLILLSYTQQLYSLYPFTFSVLPHNIKHEICLFSTKSRCSTQWKPYQSTVHPSFLSHLLTCSHIVSFPGKAC